MNMSKDLTKVSTHFNLLCALILWRFDFDIRVLGELCDNDLIACGFADGEHIAVGSRDNYVYIYQVGDGGRKYTRVGRCSVSCFCFRFHLE